jgi:hypothetical protein
VIRLADVDLTPTASTISRSGQRWHVIIEHVSAVVGHDDCVGALGR